jgi:hypothetical protein
LGRDPGANADKQRSSGLLAVAKYLFGKPG